MATNYLTAQQAAQMSREARKNQERESKERLLAEEEAALSSLPEILGRVEQRIQGAIGRGKESTIFWFERSDGPPIQRLISKRLQERGYKIEDHGVNEKIGISISWEVDEHLALHKLYDSSYLAT